MELPLFKPKIEYEPPRIGDLPSWAQAKRVAVDVECRDPQLKKLGPGVRRDGYIVGVSFAIEDGPAYYVPLRHEGGDNVESPAHAIQYFRDQAKLFRGEICGAGLQYDLDYLAEEGVIFRGVKFFRDCQIADPLLNELHFSYSLENIAARWGLPGKDETLLREVAQAYGLDPKQDLWRLPARFVAAYGVRDVRLPLQLLRRQEKDIDEQNLWEVYNLESRLLPVLVKMRRRGVRIDFEKLDKIEQWALAKETEKLKQVHLITGINITVGDVWKPDILAPALQIIGIRPPLTPKTKKFSIGQDFLDKIDHPVAKALSRARKVNKLRTTFAESIRRYAIGNRIHCTFNQLRRTDDLTGIAKGARYGRLSCIDPNLQQQPSREDFADMWRSIYVPNEGGLWASDDFSQQEPRWLVHYAEDCFLNPKVQFNYPSAKVAGDKYRNDPNTDTHTMMARIIYGLGDDQQPSKKQRTNAKIIFLGLCYGMGGGKLARNLGLPTTFTVDRYGRRIEIAGPEAQAILNLFDSKVPFVRKLAKFCEKKAKKTGYIKTITGRRCRFPENEPGRYDWTHKALNRLIQGSSGDQTKEAMVLADEAGFKLQLQLHDELGQTVYSMKEARELATLMKETKRARVPFKVDVEVGLSWGEARAWDCDTLAESLLLKKYPLSICNKCMKGETA